MRISYGNGGWVCVDADDMPGPVYLRYRAEGSRPVLSEFYLDAHDSEIASSLLIKLDLRALNLFATNGMGDWLERSVRMPSSDLSRLASHFATSFGRRPDHWIANSMRAQISGSPVLQAPFAKRRDPETEVVQPEPVRQPESGLDDEFLRSVARNYIWAISEHRRPAPAISAQAHSPVRTVHAWIRKARARGILEPTTQGRAG
jgi:hypothetical protein